MELTDGELADLARFCARRFVSPADQAQIAARAGVGFLPSEDPVAAWTDLLGSAQQAGALPRLAKVLAATAPGDRNLQEACAALVVADRSRYPRGAVIVAGALLLGGVSLGAWWWNASRGPGKPESVARAPASAVSASLAVVPVAPAVVAPAVVAPTADRPDVSPASVTLVVPPPVAPSASPSTPCATLGGEVVGYWYAGTVPPGAVGDVITLDRDARVRADYPRAENGHDARAPERCVVSRGLQVKLSHAPIDASNGHFWVPYGPADHVP